MPPTPPTHSLLQQAAAANRQGSPATALRLLQQAEAADPASNDVLLALALTHRSQNNHAAALAALDRLLAREPRHFVALLSRASLLESANPRQAARAYTTAKRHAPPKDALPPAMQQALRHGDDVIAADQRALQQHLLHHTASLRGSHPTENLDRFDESLEVFAGVARVPTQRPLLLHYSRMPAIPFHDRALFPWLPELEAATPMIAQELQAVLADAPDEFAPYVQYPPTTVANQFAELNHSRRWSSYFLWDDGKRQPDACARCPGTAALIERLPLMHQPGFAPTAVFSALEPHTHIPPHTGSANTRLLCHLPLILPGPARFRVGPQTREWKLGEAWVFDDTIDHEAWNDADRMRVILILDVWNPLLGDAEKELITAMMRARSDWYSAS